MTPAQKNSSWYKHYNEEVRKMTNRYIYLNRQAITITRKITPEEQKEYERRLNKSDCHKLVYQK